MILTLNVYPDAVILKNVHISLIAILNVTKIVNVGRLLVAVVKAIAHMRLYVKEIRFKVTIVIKVKNALLNFVVITNVLRMMLLSPIK